MQAPGCAVGTLLRPHVIAPRKRPEACWISSTMLVVGLAVISAGLASRKSGHVSCPLPTAWKGLSFLLDFSLKGINLMQKKCCVKTAILMKSCSTYFSKGDGEASFPAWPGCQGRHIRGRGRPDNSHLETQTCSLGFGQPPHLPCVQITHPKRC